MVSNKVIKIDELTTLDGSINPPDDSYNRKAIDHLLSQQDEEHAILERWTVMGNSEEDDVLVKANEANEEDEKDYSQDYSEDYSEEWTGTEIHQLCQILAIIDRELIVDESQKAALVASLLPSRKLIEANMMMDDEFFKEQYKIFVMRISEPTNNRKQNLFQEDASNEGSSSYDATPPLLVSLDPQTLDERRRQFEMTLSIKGN